jgi:quinol monooxygenase YgiN
MIHLNIWLTVQQPENVPVVRDLLAEAGRLSRAEPGCLRYEAYHSTADPNRFLLHERWESQAALDAHRKAAAYTTVYHPRILPLIVREAHPSTLVE